MAPWPKERARPLIWFGEPLGGTYLTAMLIGPIGYPNLPRRESARPTPAQEPRCLEPLLLVHSSGEPRWRLLPTAAPEPKPPGRRPAGAWAARPVAPEGSLGLGGSHGRREASTRRGTVGAPCWSRGRRRACGGASCMRLRQAAACLRLGGCWVSGSGQDHLTNGKPRDSF